MGRGISGQKCSGKLGKLPTAETVFPCHAAVMHHPDPLSEMEGIIVPDAGCASLPGEACLRAPRGID